MTTETMGIEFVWGCWGNGGAFCECPLAQASGAVTESLTLGEQGQHRCGKVQPGTSRPQFSHW